MVKFEVEKKRLEEFLKICAMEGIVQFKEGKGLRKALFSSFLLDVNPEGRLEVLTMDTIRKKTMANIKMLGVTVIKDGIIPITDYESILDCLSRMTGNVQMSYEGTVTKLENEVDVYEIRQRENESINLLNKSDIINKLEFWIKSHSFDPAGVLVMEHPVAGKVEYPMKISVNSNDLVKIVGDALKITKENKTKISFKDNILTMFSGEENARIKAKHIVPYVSLGSKTINFDADFYSLQILFGNLFEKVEFNIRESSVEKTINIHIKSVDEPIKMEINLAITSIKTEELPVAEGELGELEEEEE
jgi:hypothetical protein